MDVVDMKLSTLEMLHFSPTFYKHSCNRFILGTNNVPLLAVHIQTTGISTEIFSVGVKRLK